MIAVGNRRQTFVDLAASRGSAVPSAFTYATAGHHHHAGLATLDDMSPGLRIEPLNAQWSERERVWITSDSTLQLKLTLTGPSATSFSRQPGRLFRFLDQKLVGESKPSQGQLSVAMPARRGEVHNVSLNWRSDYGAVAANTIRVRRAAATGHAATPAKGAAR
jgi:hypothetical protein